MTATAGEEPLQFDGREVDARFIGPDGQPVHHRIEIRTHPITGRTCRVTRSRAAEREPGTGALPDPPPEARRPDACPFCRPQVRHRTPRLHPDLAPQGRLEHGRSVLFPNLFPYGAWSAVSLFDDRHFVEIGTATPVSYADSFVNAARYLERVQATDPAAVYTAVTQNHLPSAGGSLVHPHLQVHADPVPANHLRFLETRCREYFAAHDRLLFSDYLACERRNDRRWIGATGNWQWLAAFAPEGFFEIWGILPGCCSLRQVDETGWQGLARGVVAAQRFYRRCNRNGYNFGLLSVERPESRLELRAVMIVRSNYAPWVRSDHTGFELMLGDMATFTLPEETARGARPFWP